ncbi:MAG: MGMT family protein [Eubacteriales bacterium]|nr:MGMT family protein [Eubacteriales bacterium]MDD4421834.1 MGMT family protein [Eubacteriales bacterium]
MSVFSLIYEQVQRIPKGKVATYGQIANLAGNHRWSRVVGYALHMNPDQRKIPCHRVVKKDGSLSTALVFGGINEQRILLENEGVVFLEDGRVDMDKCRM